MSDAGSRRRPTSRMPDPPRAGHHICAGAPRQAGDLGRCGLLASTLPASATGANATARAAV